MASKIKKFDGMAATMAARRKAGLATGTWSKPNRTFADKKAKASREACRTKIEV